MLGEEEEGGQGGAAGTAEVHHQQRPLMLHREPNELALRHLLVDRDGRAVHQHKVESARSGSRVGSRGWGSRLGVSRVSVHCVGLIMVNRMLLRRHESHRGEQNALPSTAMKYKQMENALPSTAMQ